MPRALAPVVQVGYRVVPERKLTKPEQGHCTKAGAPPLKHLREFKARGWGGGLRCRRC